MDIKKRTRVVKRLILATFVILFLMLIRDTGGGTLNNYMYSSLGITVTQRTTLASQSISETTQPPTPWIEPTRAPQPSSSRYQALRSETSENRITGQPESSINSAVGRKEYTDVTYTVDYIPEDIALQLPACEDYKLAADYEKSRLSILGPGQTTFSLGETFSVFIRLYDGYGAPVSRGGADVRARMYNARSTAHATAAVMDHGNGTYTATFRAMWAGESKIKVKIAHNPEDIRAIYYIRKKLGSTQDSDGTFCVDELCEKTLCHPARYALVDAGHSNVCNLTGVNSGMPWYCVMPSNARLLCKHWTGGGRESPLPKDAYPITPCESALIDRSGRDMKETIDVTVKPGEMSQIVVKDPSNPCSRFNLKALWTFNQPTGFMYNDTWHLTHCKGYDNSKFFSCLQNKSVLISGDSTTRQWYKHVVDSWNCSQTTESWTAEKWHKRSACVNTRVNFTVHWLPFIGFDTERIERKSIARRLDEIGSEERVIVLIHVYLHVTVYHHSVFRERIRRIRQSVENLLNRSKNAKVLVKGFHTFQEESRRLNDYFGKVYKHILFEEFAGLHDRVVYLDQKDITDAVGINKRHPPPKVVAAMIDQMLSYVC